MNHPLSDMMTSSMGKIRDMIDVNTVIGDPICAVAGWLKLPFWPCMGWMAAGKFLRYLTLTSLLLWAVPDSWVHRLLF